jgi:hypothetical protein
MKRPSILLALVLVVVACGEPIPGSGTTTLPGGSSTGPTGTPTTSVPQDSGVAVVITATAVEQPDGSIELCPPGMTGPCPGIVLDGEIDPDLVASDDNPVVVEVTGRYDGRSLLAGSVPIQVDHPANTPVEFDSLCPDLRGTSRVNPDESLVEAVTNYTGGRADYAAMWWDRESAVLTVWFKGDDVTAHQEAIGQIAGNEPICVAGGARFSETELLEASQLLNEFVDSRGLPLATSGFGVGGVENRIDLPVEELDQETRDALAELVGERVVPHPYVYMLDASLAQLPEPVPTVEGDVEILTSRNRAGGGMDALGLFTVAYDAKLNCVFLGEGSTGVEPENSGRTVPVWPFGYSATSSPLTIYDYDGNVVAGEGGEIELGGGFVDVGFVDGNTCDAVGAWIVNR